MTKENQPKWAQWTTRIFFVGIGGAFLLPYNGTLESLLLPIGIVVAGFWATPDRNFNG